MLQTKISRRDLIKAVGSVGGLAALTPLVSTGLAGLAGKTDQQLFIEAVLTRHAGGARQVTIAHIEGFARRFSEVYGIIDYRAIFQGVMGEYRLTKLFMKSVVRHV